MLRAMRVLVVTAVISSSCCPPMQDDTTPKPVAVAPRVDAPAPSDAAVPMAPEGAPVARTVDVVDRLFGLELPDPYRWMEGASNAEHDAWLRAQGAHAAKILAASRERPALFARLREIGLGLSAVFSVRVIGPRTFHNVFPANAQLPKLAVREADGSTRILIDPETLGTAEAHVSLNAWSVSPDGSLVSYVTSRGGGEAGELRVLDVKTGKDMPEVIPRVWGENAGAWLPDSKRLLYTQRPDIQGGDPMQNQVRRLHVVGTAVDKDVTVLGREPGATFKLVPEDWPGIFLVPGGTWAYAFVGGARAEMKLAIAKLSELDVSGASKTPWRHVAELTDLVEDAVAHGDRLYLLTSKGAANRRVISVPLAKPDLANARVEIAEDSDAALVGMDAARDALYVVHMVNGLARISRWPWKGKLAPITLPYEGWASDTSARLDRDGLTFQIETWLRPGTYFRYDPTAKQVTPLGLESTTIADSSPFVAEEVEATSFDGTRVPLSILSRRDRSGAAPAVLRGYAAYGISQNAGYSASRIVWIERGGVYAVCHGRGGGEKGRRWQDDGSRDKKLNGVRDFIACGEYLVEHGYTTKGQLAAIAGSMGGVLLGRALTERPDLFAAAHLGAPIVNPLRILEGENGANQKGELGDPQTEAGYRQIAAMDPYVHVTPSTPYPAVLFSVGLNDHRVVPWMASKLAARLLASTSSKRPILLRVDADAGHGVGNTRDQGFAETADIWAFFLEQFAAPAAGVR